MQTSFHMSLPCLSITQTKAFYNSIGCALGRMTQNWVDVNLFGHQITFIKDKKFSINNPSYVFEGKILPSFHFGIIVDLNTWDTIYSKLKSLELDLVTEATFLKDKTGEHTSCFVKDPNDYMIEFKRFKNLNDMFNS